MNDSVAKAISALLVAGVLGLFSLANTATRLVEQVVQLQQTMGRMESSVGQLNASVNKLEAESRYVHGDISRAMEKNKELQR